MKNKFSMAMSLAVIMAMLFTSLALADNVKNDVVAGGNDTIIAGGSTTIYYWIHPTGGSCDAADGSSATVNLSVPAGVTASTSSLVFSVCNTQSEGNPNNTKPVVFSSSTPGTYAINITVVDSSGTYNESPAEFSLTVNPAAPTNTAPTVTVTGVANGASYEYGSVPSALCSVTDTQDGNSAFPATLSSITGPLSGYGLGSQTASCSYTDAGGLNDTDSVTYSIVDTTAPTIDPHGDETVEATGPTGAIVDYATPATHDAVFGNGVATCVPASGSLFPLGDTTVYCDASDGAGNAALQTSFIVRVQDTTPPTISCTVPDASIWYGVDVTVNCTASDAVSGLQNPADATFSLATNVAAGTETNNAQTGTKTVTDGAGNSVLVGPYAFMVDKKAPGFSCGTADGVWHANDVSIACTASDGGSGLATAANFSLSTNVPANTEDANASTGTAAVTDNVGNSTTAGPIAGNMVEKKAPTNISFVGGGIVDGGVYYFGFVPAGPTSCTADDLGSGLASCNVTGGGTGVGSHFYTATATDYVGNSDTATLSYTVKAWTLNGFYQPVDMNGVLNIVKGGSTVPLKFEVFAGPTELTSTSAVKSFTVQVVSCTTSAAIDDIELTTTGGTTLRYDATGGQFVQNWQTPRGAGICYKVTMTTQDDSFLSALFKTK